MQSLKEHDQKKIKDEDNFNGQYSDSGSSVNGEDDFGEADEEQPIKAELKKKQQLQKKQSKKVTKKQKPKGKQKILFNVADTKYRVVYFVGKKVNQWKLQYDSEATDWDVCWTDNAVQTEQIGKMSHHQKINHFPGMYSLARKNHLGRNLMKLKKQFPDQYKFFPQTWILPADYNDFKFQFDKKQKGKARTFIVKPEAGCQGRGIFLTRNIEDLNTNDHYVVQRYMHKPYLIDGLKFDLRIYVMIAGCDPLRIYMYDEGLVRFSTEEYQPPNKDNLDDLCMHLTNYAINKDNPNFVFNDNDKKMDVGHKRSLTSVFEMLRAQGHDTDIIMEQIKDIIVKTMCCAQPILAHEYKASQPDNYMNNMCFEILGFDVLLDDKLKPYLIEINHTPSFATDTPLDSLIKKNCIKDGLKIMNISMKTRNETIAIRKEIMQKRVLTGKKVKLTQEEKQQMIEEGQKKRNEWEDKNMGRYYKLYPLPEKDGEPQEDMYKEFYEYASKMYGISTGANIRRNTKKVLDQKEQEKLQQQQKPLNKTKEIEKIYSQKLAGVNKGSNQKIQPINQNPLAVEKQQQQLTAMQRLSKGGSSIKPVQQSNTNSSNFYQDQDLQQESGDEQYYQPQQNGQFIQQQYNQQMYNQQQQQQQQQYQYMQQNQQLQPQPLILNKEKEFRIKSSQNSYKSQYNTSNYATSTRRTQNQEDTLYRQALEEQDENLPSTEKPPSRNSGKRVLYGTNLKKQQNSQFPLVNDYATNPNNPYNNKQHQYKNRPPNKVQIKPLPQQQYQLVGGFGQNYNLYDQPQQKDGGLFVTPKLFDLNMLQKNQNDTYSNYNQSAELYRKINVINNGKKKDYTYDQSKMPMHQTYKK